MELSSWNFQVGSIPLHEEESGRASHFGPEEMQHKECGRKKNVSQCSMKSMAFEAFQWKLSNRIFPMKTFHDACSKVFRANLSILLSGYWRSALRRLGSEQVQAPGTSLRMLLWILC